MNSDKKYNHYANCNILEESSDDDSSSEEDLVSDSESNKSESDSADSDESSSSEESDEEEFLLKLAHTIDIDNNLEVNSSDSEEINVTESTDGDSSSEEDTVEMSDKSEESFLPVIFIPRQRKFQRYFDFDMSVICTICGRNGHEYSTLIMNSRFNCDRKDEFQPCYVCSNTSHKSINCPELLCLNCGNAGHTRYSCPNSGTYCTRCFSYTHHKEVKKCPSLIMREGLPFAIRCVKCLKTNCNCKIDQKTVYKPSCVVCSEEGHCAFEHSEKIFNMTRRDRNISYKVVENNHFQNKNNYDDKKSGHRKHHHNKRTERINTPNEADKKKPPRIKHRKFKKEKSETPKRHNRSRYHHKSPKVKDEF